MPQRDLQTTPPQGGGDSKMTQRIISNMNQHGVVSADNHRQNAMHGFRLHREISVVATPQQKTDYMYFCLRAREIVKTGEVFKRA